MARISEVSEDGNHQFWPNKSGKPSIATYGESKNSGLDHPEKPIDEKAGLRRAGGSGKWDDRLVQAVNFSGEAAESFRVLRSKILMPQDGRPAPRTIMVASVLPKEGKSFICGNLGIALAQGVDQYALLVDCDLRLPSLASIFGLANHYGLADYLKDNKDLATLIQKTSMEKLSILTSGAPPANPAELLGSNRMHQLIGELSSRYPDRFVIFDSPPLKAASESMTLAQVVDGVILVVRHGVSSRALIEQAIADIGKEKLLGVVFNGHKSNFITSRLINKSYSYYGDYYRNNTLYNNDPVAADSRERLGIGEKVQREYIGKSNIAGDSAFLPPAKKALWRKWVIWGVLGIVLIGGAVAVYAHHRGWLSPIY